MAKGKEDDQAGSELLVNRLHLCTQGEVVINPMMMEREGQTGSFKSTRNIATICLLITTVLL